MKPNPERANALSALIEHSPLAIVLLDEQHRIKLANPAFEKLFLYRAEEILGTDLDDLIAADGADSRAEAREFTRRVLSGESVHTTTRRRRKDGSPADVEMHGIPLFEEGRLWGVYAIYQDISQRRKAEEALRRSELKYREIVNFAPLGFFQSTLDRRLLMVNAAFARILGYDSPEDLLAHARPEEFYYHAEERQTLIAKYDPIGVVTDLEVLFKKRDGSPVWVQIAFHIVKNERGEPSYLEGFVSDISERKRREEERQEVERLKDEFVAMVSHDLKTPLASIRLSLELLGDGTLGPVSPKARDVITVAEKNVARMMNLANDILDLKRLDAGRMHLDLERLPVQTPIDRAFEVVQPLASARGVRLVGGTWSLAVRGDATRLTQVMVNLLSNAVKFSPPDSTVTVTVSGIGEWVEVRVLDRGCGVPAEHQQAIFEPFRQVRSSDSHVRGGSGLGLAICRAIVLQHGGSMGVESEPGKGSEFWLRLPAEPSEG